MTISMGSLGSSIMRLAAANAVESDQENKLLIDATSKQEELAIRQDLSNKKAAEGMRQFQSTVQFVQEGVQAGKATVSAGQAVGNFANQVGGGTESNISDQIDSARAGGTTSGGGTGEADALADLKGIQLQDGGSVGQRFDDRQLSMLVGSQEANGEQGSGWTKMSETDARAELSAAGFTEAETDQLIEMGLGGDGLTGDEAASFVFDNRYDYGRTFDQAGSQAIGMATGLSGFDPNRTEGPSGKDILGLAMKYASDGFNQVMSNAQKQVAEAGGKQRQYGQEIEAMQKELQQATAEHNEEIGELHLELLRGEIQTGAK